MSINEQPTQLHIPVLLGATLAILQPKKGESYLDLTAGYGGHAKEFLAKTGSYEKSVLVDRDEFAISKLQFLKEKGVSLLHQDFVTAAKKMIEQGKKFDIILVDLGVSSPQLDQSERGFSFRHEAALDMRMDRRQELSAAEIINTFSEKELYEIIRRYGEEKPIVARKIAEMICEKRPYVTTTQLAHDIQNTVRGFYRKSKINPATRTFQAIRIVVNQELQQVEEMLVLLPQLLQKNGRVGVISFHSLEDRIVKKFFAQDTKNGFEAEFQIITKKPIDGALNDVHNPRARSAKLRAAVKI